MALPAGLAFPEGLAVTLDGNLLVVEAGAGRLSRIDTSTGEVSSVADGLELGARGPASAAPPTWTFNGVAVGPSGAIYVTGDTANLLYRLEAPATLPETGSAALPTYALVMGLGSLGILGGLGLALLRRRSAQRQ